MKPVHLKSIASAFLATASTSTACLLHGRHDVTPGMPNDPARRTHPPHNSTQPAPASTAITNARWFDGTAIQDPSTIVIRGSRIVSLSPSTDLPYDRDNTTTTTTIDAQGAVLLPGLIDAHCHPGSVADLETLASFGITSALSMSCLNYTTCALLRDQPGLPSFISAGYPAQGANSSHALTYHTSAQQLISSPAQAPAYVAAVQANSSDFLKITAEINGPDQATQDALVTAAHAAGLQSMTHASTVLAYQQAIRSLTDGPQHAPIDGILNTTWWHTMAAQNQFGTPTMEAARLVLSLSAQDPSIGATIGVGSSASNTNSSYAHWTANVRAMHRAGIPLLAGTDASPSVASVLNGTSVFGWSLHREMQNLVEDAGLSNAAALRAATVLAAEKHRLWDRGRIAVGMRADLVLLEAGADPVANNITDTRMVHRVWIGGAEYQHVAKWDNPIYDI